MTNNLDLDAIEAAIKRNGYYVAGPALIAELRDLRSQLAESQRENADRETMKAAYDALNGIWRAILAVQWHLTTPYDEHPEWTPWTRFVKPALDEVESAMPLLRTSLASEPS